jgi:hypothetical protein
MNFFVLPVTEVSKEDVGQSSQDHQSSRAVARSNQRIFGSSTVKSHMITGCLVHEARNLEDSFFDPPATVNKKQPAPTPAMIAHQHEYITNPKNNFKCITVGKAFVFDSDTHDLISFSEIQEISKLSAPEFDDLCFIAQFLHQNKEFISPIPNSHKWGGKMWGIGWRVATEQGVIVGRYLKIDGIAKNIPDFEKVNQDLARASQILSEWFQSTANKAFEKNQQEMQDTGTPGFAILNLPETCPEATNSCANHLTFTTQRFANFPHSDATDHTDYAFMFTFPTHAITGQQFSSSLSSQDTYRLISNPLF